MEQNGETFRSESRLRGAGKELNQVEREEENQEQKKKKKKVWKFGRQGSWRSRRRTLTLNPPRSFSRGMELRAFPESSPEEQRKTKESSLQRAVGLQAKKRRNRGSNFALEDFRFQGWKRKEQKDKVSGTTEQEYTRRCNGPPIPIPIPDGYSMH